MAERLSTFAYKGAEMSLEKRFLLKIARYLFKGVLESVSLFFSSLKLIDRHELLAEENLGSSCGD